MPDDHPSQRDLSFHNGRSRRSLFIGAFVGLVLVGMVAMGALVLVVSASPSTGAQGADWLRNLIGTKAVAQLEAVVFTLQDKFHQLTYKIEKSTPSAPWDVSSLQSETPQGITSLVPGTPTPLTSAQNSTHTPAGEGTPIEANLPSVTGTPAAVLANLPQTAAPDPTQTAWAPARLTPLGNIPDEGIWEPYISDSAGNIVAYKTFLQPDSERPYVTVGIVAFDLTRTHLHYVLGLIEPTSNVSVPRTGQIPAADQLPGVLLAAFNGGFKTVHGDYGVYTDGTELVPPIDGMGTLAIYTDGSIRIGEWGSDMTFTPDMAIYRQNCPLMVHNGEINPQVYNNSVNDWGGTISGNIVTFRSGIGLSQDGKTLYYFAGNTLTMPVLAKAMLDAGAYQAMQLDINNYYVFFTAFEVQNEQLTGMPLLHKDMFDNLNRYLDGFAHDFFYVTTSQP